MRPFEAWRHRLNKEKLSLHNSIGWGFVVTVGLVVIELVHP